MPNKEREAAGVIVYRLSQSGSPEFLLLRSVELGIWGVPKGHRDAEDLDLLACAQRELREETGLGKVLLHSGFRASLAYEAKRHNKGETYHKTVCYFLGRWEGGEVVRSGEHDAAEWLAETKAKTLLKFANLVEVLDNACEYLEMQCNVIRGKDSE